MTKKCESDKKKRSQKLRSGVQFEIETVVFISGCPREILGKHFKNIGAEAPLQKWEWCARVFPKLSRQFYGAVGTTRVPWKNTLKPFQVFQTGKDFMRRIRCHNTGGRAGRVKIGGSCWFLFCSVLFSENLRKDQQHRNRNLRKLPLKTTAAFAPRRVIQGSLRPSSRSPGAWMLFTKRKGDGFSSVSPSNCQGDNLSY